MTKYKNKITNLILGGCLCFVSVSWAQAPVSPAPQASAAQGTPQTPPVPVGVPMLDQDGAAATGADHAPVLVKQNEPDNKDESYSFSDLAVDELSKTSAASQRNPFAPGVFQEEFDPSALVVEGVIIGPRAKMALISGQVISAGERLGNYTVKDILPGKVILKQLEDEFLVRMENFQQPFFERRQDRFFVEFQGAPLVVALGMLAKADSINMILPQAIEGKVSVSFNNTEVLDVVAAILRVNTLEYAIENNIMRIGKAEAFKDGSDLKTLSYPLRYATAKDMKDMLKAFLSERGSSTFDERTNTVIVKDHANVIDSVQNFLTSVDKKDPQVSIEAKIIDASSSFARSLGVQWGVASITNHLVASGNQDVGTFSGGGGNSTLINLPASSPTSGADILIGRLPGNTNIQLRLSAAESTGAIRIISKPKVTTINNKTAKIRSGVKLFVKIDGGADAGPTLKEIDTGIELSVTPQITINRMIKMMIEASESEADFSRTVDGIPAILDNSATTTVLIPDGETAVIGGLLKVRTTKERRKVPGVGDVPVLGWLFRSTNRTKDNNELMLFITPQVLDSDYFKTSSSDQVTATKN